MKTNSNDTFYIYFGFINKENNQGLATSEEIYNYKKTKHHNIKFVDLTDEKTFITNLSNFIKQLDDNNKYKNLHIYLDLHGKENGFLSIKRGKNKKAIFKQHIEEIIDKLQPENVKFTNYICHGGMSDLNELFKKINREKGINIIVSTPSIEHIIQPHFENNKFIANTCIETDEISNFNAGKKYYFYNKDRKNCKDRCQKEVNKVCNCQITKNKEQINEIKKQIGYKK